MSEKILVVQHNAIIEARYKLSVEEQRLIKTLVSQIQTNDEDFKVYEIRIIDLAKLLGISDTGYYDRIKRVTKKILGNVLCFTDDNGNYIQTNWLSSAKYYKGKGVVALRFDPELKPYLLQLKRLFTSYELGNILSLKGMYSIRIYELLKQYEKIGRREFTLGGLKQTLKIDEEYKQYKDFKKFVLIPSQKEISEKTDIKYSIAEITRGRKVTGLVFDIASNKREIGTEQHEKIIGIDDAEKQVTNLDNKTLLELSEIGVTRRVAEELCREYDEEHIYAMIAYTEYQYQQGKVKNFSGFLVDAIKNGYRDNYAEERKKQEITVQEAKAREEKANRWERIKEAYKKSKDATFEKWYPTLNQDDVAKYRESYVATLSPYITKNETMTERIFLAHFKNDVMKSPSLREWMGKQKNINMAEFEEELRREEIEQAKSKEVTQRAGR